MFWKSLQKSSNELRDYFPCVSLIHKKWPHSARYFLFPQGVYSSRIYLVASEQYALFIVYTRTREKKLSCLDFPGKQCYFLADGPSIIEITTSCCEINQFFFLLSQQGAIAVNGRSTVIYVHVIGSRSGQVHLIYDYLRSCWMGCTLVWNSYISAESYVFPLEKLGEKLATFLVTIVFL